MSFDSRREYLSNMQQRYRRATLRTDKSQIISEVVKMLGYNRKYAIQVLNNPIPVKKPPGKQTKPLKYSETLPAIQLVWEAPDYLRAERPHPVLLSTAELLASRGELFLMPQVREQLAQISRSTLARRMTRWRFPKFNCRQLIPLHFSLLGQVFI